MLDNQDLTVIILSIGPGAMLGLLGLGLVTIYRSTGILNVSHGAMATLGAYIYFEVTTTHGLPPWSGLVISAVAVGVAGVVIYGLVMRPLRTASPVTKLTASAGVLIVIQSSLQWRYGSVFHGAEPLLPGNSVELFGDTRIGVDRLVLAAIAVVVTASLWLVYRHTKFGISTEASAENQVIASVFGLRTDRLAIGNWFIAGALAGGAGALLAPLVGLNLTQLSTLIVPVMAAALVGSLSSFPLTLVGALFIAAAQGVISTNTSVRGAADIVPLAIIVVMMVVRGKSIPTRSAVGLKLPAIGLGRIRPVPVFVGFLITLVSIFSWLPKDWMRPLLGNLVISIILLSVVVVTGYCGQVSLAQYAFAGFGAFMAGTMMFDHGWPFFLAAGFSLVCALALGAVIALPSIRMRGVSLSVVTLGAAVMLHSVFFNSVESMQVKTPTIFGWDLSLIREPKRYVTMALIVLLVLSLMVANLRRSGTGRRMIAVRGNERAAASVGINVAATKITAFSISSMIAAAGGILIAFQSPIVSYSNFDAFSSINALAWSVIGGVGFVLGPLLGSQFAHGTIGSKLGLEIYDNTAVLGVIGGLFVIVTLIAHPDGMASLAHQFRERKERRRAKRNEVAKEKAADVELVVDDRPRNGRTAILKIRDVSVAFGGVHALRNVSLEVRPGQVHGLIGPNGAGKTTLLDSVSGFVVPKSGTVSLGDFSLVGAPTWKRARLGLGRSFQNVQLFPDLTVLENLRVAGDVRKFGSVPFDLIKPGKDTIGPAAFEAITMLELHEQLHQGVEHLSHGQRQLVAIARALAADPQIVMLDEPAAGLDGQEREEFGQLLRRLASERNLGVLLVEHDVELVLGVSDWVTVLHRGEVIASGPPEVVRSAPHVIEAYLGDSNAEAGSEEEGELIDV
jgi:ABC-type branched-subunit amino acid transport system ATPase component/branched-subunit amino acid ABC-type transport system permease component